MKYKFLISALDTCNVSNKNERMGWELWFYTVIRAHFQWMESPVLVTVSWDTIKSNETINQIQVQSIVIIMLQLIYDFLKEQLLYEWLLPLIL